MLSQSFTQTQTVRVEEESNNRPTENHLRGVDIVTVPRRLIKRTNRLDHKIDGDIDLFKHPLLVADIDGYYYLVDGNHRSVFTYRQSIQEVPVQILPNRKVKIVGGGNSFLHTFTSQGYEALCERLIEAAKDY